MKKLIGIIGITLMCSTPASAGTQDDIKTCRVAMSVQSDYDMRQYRLRFLSQKGNTRNMVINIRAIHKKGGDNFEFSCHLKKSQIQALYQDKTVFYERMDTHQMGNRTSEVN